MDVFVVVVVVVFVVFCCCFLCDWCECVYECAWYHNTFLVYLSFGNKVVLYCVLLYCMKKKKKKLTASWWSQSAQLKLSTQSLYICWQHGRYCSHAREVSFCTLWRKNFIRSTTRSDWWPAACSGSFSDGIRTETADIIMTAWREGTGKCYNTCLRRCFLFCSQQDANLFRPSPTELLIFLTMLLFQEKISYCFLNKAGNAVALISLNKGTSTGARPTKWTFITVIDWLSEWVSEWVSE